MVQSLEVLQFKLLCSLPVTRYSLFSSKYEPLTHLSFIPYSLTFFVILHLKLSSSSNQRSSYVPISI